MEQENYAKKSAHCFVLSWMLSFCWKKHTTWVMFTCTSPHSNQCYCGRLMSPAMPTCKCCHIFPASLQAVTITVRRAAAAGICTEHEFDTKYYTCLPCILSKEDRWNRAQHGCVYLPLCSYIRHIVQSRMHRLKINETTFTWWWKRKKIE